MKLPEGLGPDDPRLLAYALGELTDPAELSRLEAAVAKDPALAAAVARHRELSSRLDAMFAKEPLPYVNPDAIVSRVLGAEAAPAGARRRAGGLGGSAGRVELPAPSRRRPVLWGASVAAAACVAAFLYVRTEAPVSSAVPVVASESANGAMRPAGMSLAGASASRSLATLAAALPALPGVGSGAYSQAATAPVSLRTGDAVGYTDAFVREVTQGRRPPPEFTRLDGLVNTFVAGRATFPGSRPVKVETALTDAPWDTSRRLLRVTVYAKGVAGEIAARRAHAEIRFDPAAVKSWRVLGYREGSALSSTASLRAGEAVTTLYEIEPVVARSDTGAFAEVAVLYTRADTRAREVETASVSVADHKAFADTDSDTRFAGGLAAYALNLGDDPSGALVAAADGDAARLAFARHVR